jgi:hypothetical protein
VVLLGAALFITSCFLPYYDRYANEEGVDAEA